MPVTFLVSGDWFGELHPAAGRDGEFLPDFAQRTMKRHAVAAHAVLNLAEEQGNALLSACTAGTAHAGDGEWRIGQQVGLQQRNQGQQNAGGIAARAGDEPRGLDVVRTDFREGIDGFVEQLGCDVGVAVEFLIQRSAPQPEVGAEIDHAQAEFEQRLRVFGGNAVRQRQEGDFGTSVLQGVRVRRGEGQCVGKTHAAEPRELLGERLSGEGTRCDCHEFGMRMPQQQTQQFGSRITTGSNDGDFDGCGHNAGGGVWDVAAAVQP